ncbi:MAG TPA: tRNA threonylcarbamoyladenosine biosynthesis protein TsaB, partial [Cytophagaceae bacterium]
MSVLLSLETSTQMCSVALHKEGNLLSYSSFMMEKSHSKVILPLIDNILKDASLSKTDIQAVAVAKGPGS